MATAGRPVEAKRIVSAAPDIVFTVITAAADITGWLSHEARCEARPGGIYELRWNSGYAVHGQAKAVTAPSTFAVAWQGSGEPGGTTVTFTLAPVSSGTDVTVRQSGFGRGKTWEKVIAESRRGWERSLENLQHLVETGVDLREARRPVLGINPGDPADADRPAGEGIAAAAGIYLAGVVAGSSAEAAGLRAGRRGHLGRRIACAGFRRIAGRTARAHCRRPHRGRLRARPGAADSHRGAEAAPDERGSH